MLPSVFQLKSFRMSLELDHAGLFPVRSIDDRDSTIAKADINAIRGRLVTHVIGIILEVEFCQKTKGSGIVNLHAPVLIRGDIEAFRLRHISNSLRRTQTRDGMDSLAVAQIDYFDAVVAACTDK